MLPTSEISLQKVTIHNLMSKIPASETYNKFRFAIHKKEAELLHLQQPSQALIVGAGMDDFAREAVGPCRLMDSVGSGRAGMIIKLQADSSAAWSCLSKSFSRVIIVLENRVLLKE